MTVAWDRLPGESSKAYAAFLMYRDLGPMRSLRKVTRSFAATNDDGVRNQSHTGITPVSEAWMKKYSSRHNWVERAELYDDHLAHVLTEEAEKARVRMLERHINSSLAMQGKALSKIRTIEADDLTAGEARKYMMAGMAVEEERRREALMGIDAMTKGAGVTINQTVEVAAAMKLETSRLAEDIIEAMTADRTTREDARKLIDLLRAKLVEPDEHVQDADAEGDTEGAHPSDA